MTKPNALKGDVSFCMTVNLVYVMINVSVKEEMKPDNIEYNREQVKSYIQSIRNCKPVSAIYDARDFNGEIQMSKYIKDADAAEKISEQYGIPFWELADVFKGMYATDVKEVKHGHWKYDDGMDLECSRCGRLALTPFYSSVQYRSRYCPNCGAKMDGGER